MLNIQSLIRFPVPMGILDTKGLSESEIKSAIYKAYGFDREEIEYIESYI